MFEVRLRSQSSDLNLLNALALAQRLAPVGNLKTMQTTDFIIKLKPVLPVIKTHDHC